jgi:PAS domain S-box-containing protein
VPAAPHEHEIPALGEGYGSLFEPQFADVVDAADAAIIGRDRAGLVSVWSAGAARLFGHERQDVLGRPISDFLVPPERQDETRRVLETLARGEPVPRFETVRRHKDGRLISTSVTVSPIWADGKVVGSTAVEHDVSAERLAEDARIGLELGEADVKRQVIHGRARHTFINEASHELNTPLTPLRIHLEALSRGEDVTARQRQHLEVIERNVLRLCDIVKDLLEASRLETGRFQLEHTEVALAALIEDAVKSQSEIAKSAGVTLAIGPLSQLKVDVDRSRIGQVLDNFLSNAISYTPRGGRVTLSAGLEDGWAVVRVTDTGIGLSAKQLDDLFKPFSRPNDGLGSGPRGTGLASFISKAVIEHHGGRIWAESPGTGHGSSFCFALPLKQAPAGPGRGTVVGHGANLSLRPPGTG